MIELNGVQIRVRPFLDGKALAKALEKSKNPDKDLDYFVSERRYERSKIGEIK